jgi:hypothetical protein
MTPLTVNEIALMGSLLNDAANRQNEKPGEIELSTN